MELTGKLKDKMAQAKSKDEAKEIMENAGMKLTDDELDTVAGGLGIAVAEGSPKTYKRGTSLGITADMPRRDKLIYDNWVADGCPDFRKTTRY